MSEVPYLSSSPDLSSPQTAEQLGGAVRHARRMRGMRLKDLAEIAGCSESMLSKIETGGVIPSLNLLRRIVDGLDISILGLFGAADASEHMVHRAGSRPKVSVGQAGPLPSVVLELLMPRGEGLMLEANIHTVNPGGSSAGATSHIGEEFGYVLDGELELTVDGEVMGLMRGDSFCFRSERPHAYRNRGDVPARVLWVNTPPTY
ncbi:MAG: helix-turn-helix transcriptional regulator [Rhodospirillaceae bacterium]|nr:helix-turn-helix transcriptional regulator [Rhodospirillaceae bacterium]